METDPSAYKKGTSGGEREPAPHPKKRVDIERSVGGKIPQYQAEYRF